MADSENKSDKSKNPDQPPSLSALDEEEQKSDRFDKESAPLPQSSSGEDEQLNSNRLKPLPNELRVDTSNAIFNVHPQYAGSQKMAPNNKPASIASSAARSQQQSFRAKASDGVKRSELPTDTRPDRKQRPEDLKRAKYLTTVPITEESEKDEKSKIGKRIKKKPPTCWVTTSWILTWWAPPFMLRTFGKAIKRHQFLFIFQ